MSTGWDSLQVKGRLETVCRWRDVWQVEDIYKYDNEIQNQHFLVEVKGKTGIFNKRYWGCGQEYEACIRFRQWGSIILNYYNKCRVWRWVGSVVTTSTLTVRWTHDIFYLQWLKSPGQHRGTVPCRQSAYAMMLTILRLSWQLALVFELWAMAISVFLLQFLPGEEVLMAQVSSWSLTFGLEKATLAVSWLSWQPVFVCVCDWTQSLGVCK